MNTTLASERSLDRDEQQILADARSPRIPLVDRLSLRLGLWLLLRSTRRIRTIRAHDLLAHQAHETARASQRAREARDAVGISHLRAHRA
jgi:hypothetical protein